MGQKKRSPGQGLKLLLIRDYLYNEATKEHPKNSKAIIAYLAEHDIKASVTTIHTDIMRLREDLGIPIAYNPNKYGYYISKPKFEIGELEVLIDCIRCSTFMTEKDSAQLIQKVKGLANSYDRKLIEERMAEEGKKQHTDNSIIQNIQLIQEAIDRKCKISYQLIQYVAEHSTHTEIDPEIEFASPHKLTWESGKYVLECAIDVPFDEEWFKEEERAFFDECLAAEYDGSFEDYYKATYGNRHKSVGTVSQLYTSIDISRFTNLTVTNLPSTYQKEEQETATANNNQSAVQAITIRFRKEMLKRVATELGKDAILISEDDRYFTTSIRRVADREFFQWLYTFDCYAKILRPQKVIDRYLYWCRSHLVDLEILYERNLEPYYALTDDEFENVRQEDDRILYAAEMGRWKCHHELLLPDDGEEITASPEMLKYVGLEENMTE